MNGDSPCQRRDFLKMATVGTVGLAGCGASSEEPQFRISSFYLMNLHDVAHTFDVTVTESEEVRFEERVRLGPADRADDPKIHEFSEYPTEPGAYALDVTLDDSVSPLGGVPSWSDFAESTECAILIPQVWRDGSAAIVYSTTCAPLSETRNADDA
jgi:hypothetical protein